MADGDMPSMPDPIFNRLLKDRIIWMGEEVKDDMANRICAQLLMLAAEDPKKDIWLYINSPGGSITAGMAIYDTMQLIPCDVSTTCVGTAGSRVTAPSTPTRPPRSPSLTPICASTRRAFASPPAILRASTNS